MNDRELLELAARAAGCYGLGEWDDKWNCLTNYEGWTFDPLTDDGDALRLAYTTGLNIYCSCGFVSAEYADGKRCREVGFSDVGAATRRAIVRAAAEIGRTMTTRSVR